MRRFIHQRGPGTPPRREPTAHELRVFLSLWEERHFGRAATRMGIAQSSFSEALRRLEDKLDAVLFERTSRRVWPTDAGADLVPHAVRTLGGLHRLTDRPDPADASAETIRIGIEGQGFADLNGPIVAAIRARFARSTITVREVTGDPHSYFDERLDIALMLTPMPEELFRVRCVAYEERGLLVPDTHEAAGETGLRAEDFLDEPFVELVPRYAATRSYWLGDSLRGGDRANVGGAASTSADAVFAIAYDGLLSTGSPSALRAFPHAPLGYIGTTDLPPNPWHVVTAAADAGPLGEALVDAVMAVVRTHAAAIPGVHLADDPSRSGVAAADPGSAPA